MVKTVYGQWWGSLSKQLAYLDAADYMVDEAERQINAMRRSRDLFAEQGPSDNTVIAYYLDLADPAFDEQFERLLVLPRIHGLFRLTCLVFAFACLGESQEVARRCMACFDRVRAWTEDNEPQMHMVCMSDVVSGSSGSVLLDEFGMAESYRACADIVLLANTPGEARQVLMNGLLRWHCFGMAYRAAGKNVRAIVAVALQAVLQGLAGYDSGKAFDGGFIERLGFENYEGLCEYIYTLLIAPHIDQRVHDSLYLVPYTDAVRALEEGLIGKGVLGRRKAETSKRRDLTVSAADSLRGEFDGGQGVWELLQKAYFAGPVSAWLEAGGRAQLHDFLTARLSSCFGYREMNALFGRQRGALLAKDSPAADEWAPSLTMVGELGECADYADCLFACAVDELKQRTVMPLVLDTMGNTLQELQTASATCVDAIQSFERDLERENVPDSIQRAYGEYASQLVRNHEGELYQDVLPVAGDEFYGLLRRLFDRLVRCDDQGVFGQSIEGDIAFQRRAAPGMTVDDVVADCFSGHLDSSLRVPIHGTYNQTDGVVFTLLGMEEDGVIRATDRTAVGEVVRAPWGTSIERLGLYPIDPDCIMWE